ncbi:MAG: hypothetical protein RIT81_00205 [Deltaproteobacteria bacterium]
MIIVFTATHTPHIDQDLSFSDGGDGYLQAGETGFVDLGQQHQDVKVMLLSWRRSECSGGTCTASDSLPAVVYPH